MLLYSWHLIGYLRQGQQKSTGLCLLEVLNIQGN